LDLGRNLMNDAERVSDDSIARSPTNPTREERVMRDALAAFTARVERTSRA
jgi:hypothetical protein